MQPSSMRCYRQAEAKAKNCYRFTISFSQDHLIGSELSGPDRRAVYAADNPQQIDIVDLARQADVLNLSVLEGGADLWRPEARLIGQTVYQVLAGDGRVLRDLTAARGLVNRSRDLWLEISTPAAGLGVPFEILRDEDDYLSLSHVLSRRLIRPGPILSRKPQSFHDFLHQLAKRKEALRILVVASNSDGRIPAVESEVTELAVGMDGDLKLLGIAHEITLLSGAEATYSRVREALHSGGYHIVHYAGHGRYDDKLPEVSGLVLRDGQGMRVLTAADLKTLALDTELRLVYLSCCLGARTALQAGRGDFHGVVEALALADVPIVLGYRWTVRDEFGASHGPRILSDVVAHFFAGRGPFGSALQHCHGSAGSR